MPETQNQPTAQTPPPFEESLKQLEAIVHDLEDGQLGLGDALGRYEQGVKLLKHCYGVLEKTERRIELLCGVDAEGNPITEPFDDAATFDGDEATGTRTRKRTAGGGKGAKKTGKSPPDPAAPEVDGAQGLF